MPWANEKESKTYVCSTGPIFGLFASSFSSYGDKQNKTVVRGNFTQ